ncbi:MAG: hypothetical protein BGO41_03975 [Clostridiales bacterium 38-18]|nr:MAG: hypothetical protein BGO41_03975 [Clostridiales bacterium 38-18]
MKKMRFLTRLIGILIIVALILVMPILLSGYQMYKDAVEGVPLSEKVASLKSDPSYAFIAEISPSFLEQVVTSEDRKFYDHFGINLSSTARAFIKNFLAGAKVEGGSSITQQLAKNMYFSFEKQYERKVAELFVAFEIERVYEKADILEMYVNIAYFGEGAYGIREASKHYYGVEPIQLTEEQSAALVYTLKSPNYYNPNALSEKGSE